MNKRPATNYAMKIGEILLRSPEPITEEQRKNAVRYLARADRVMVTEDGLVIDDVTLR